MFGTTIIYIAIYIIIMRRLRSNYFNTSTQMAQHANKVARYMVIYPFTYVICTLPIAACRMASMTGREIPFAYYIFAGAMITSNGWLDVLLYSLTRRVIVFSDAPPVEECGLETFGTGIGKDGFGNHVVIEGGCRLEEGRNTPNGVKQLESVKTNYKITTVTVESRRLPVADTERLRLPTHIGKEEDTGWDSASSSSA
jgi:hypothetical protein